MGRNIATRVKRPAPEVGDFLGFGQLRLTGSPPFLLNLTSLIYNSNADFIRQLQREGNFVLRPLMRLVHMFEAKKPEILAADPDHGIQHGCDPQRLQIALDISGRSWIGQGIVGGDMGRLL